MISSQEKQPQGKITVLLADDHRLVRLGFRRMLEDEPDIEVVGEADNGLQAIELAEKLRPAVAVVDMSMPELDGVQAIHEIGRRAPDTRVLVLSMYDERSYIRNALKAGALGYVLKNAIDVDLISAVKTVAEGRRFLSEPLSFKDLESDEPDDPLERLTQRERQILQLIAQAHSNKEIAGLLNISVNTVNVHRTNLMHSLNLHSTAELVLFAVQKGLITLPK
ncbi:MAG: response regulator transcription factor [Bryobacterales bacterium]